MAISSGVNDIDERVVRLTFDNAAFERGTKQSVKTLGELNKSLESVDGDSFNKLNAGAKSVNLNPISKGVESIKASFSSLGVIGASVLQRLTNEAINLGQKLVKEFITPITTGLQEYELQTNATQTIMANTMKYGTTMEEVSATLDDLNAYADRTIYNFAQMTDNLGKFTTAGLELETSAEAIKGLSNVAALFGVEANKLPNAMYQVSQELNTGYMSLMGWMSLENSGMAGSAFQESLMETARIHGVAIDQMIADEGSFRLTLQNQWLTTDILLETLSKFTGDLTDAQLASMGYNEEQIRQIQELAAAANSSAQDIKTFTQLIGVIAEMKASGWASSWKIIVGDLEEAKAVFKAINSVLEPLISNGNEARNALLQGWADLGGRNHLLESFFNIMKAIGRIFIPIKEAWESVFPPSTAQGLYNVTSGLERFTAGLIISEEAAVSIAKTFRILFVVLKLGFEVVGIAGQVLIGIFRVLVGVVGLIFDVFGNLSDLLFRTGDDMADAGAESKGLGLSLNWVSTAIDNMVANLSKLGTSIKETITLEKVLTTAIAVGIIVAMVRLINMLRDLSSLFKTTVGVGADTFVDTMKEVNQTLDAVQLQLKAEAMLSIAKAVALLAVSIIALAFVPFDKLVQGVGAVVAILIALSLAIIAVGKAGTAGLAGGVGLFAIALSLNMLLLPLTALALAPHQMIIQGLAYFGATLALLVATTFALSKIPTDNILKNVLAITVIAYAIVTLMVPVAVMAVLPWGLYLSGLGKMALTLLVLSGILIGFVALSRLAAFDFTWMISVAGAFVILATAVNLMIIPLTLLGVIPFEVLAKGLGTLIFTIAGLTAALLIMAPFATILANVAGSILKFSLASLGLVAAITILGASLLLLALIGDDTLKAIGENLNALLPLLLQIIADAAGHIADAAITIITELLLAIESNIGPIMDIIINIIRIVVDAVWIELQKVDPLAAATLVGFVLVIAGLAKLMGGLVKDAAKALVAGAMMTVLFGIVASVFYIIRDIDGENMSSQAIAITGAIVGIIAITKLMGILGAIPITLVLKGLAVVGLVIAAFGVIMTLLGYIEEWTNGGASDILDKGADILIAIGNGIGGFLGGILGGIAEGAASAAPAIGQYMSDFMINAGTFIDGMSDVDESVLDKMSVFSDVVGIFMDIAKNGTVDMTPLMTMLDALGPIGLSMQTYAGTLTTVDVAAVEQSANAISLLSSAAQIVTTYGVDGTELSKFASGLEPFGESFAAYAKTVESVTTAQLTAIEGTAVYAQILIDLADNVPNEGGFLGAIMGENNIATFGANMVLFGKSFAEYGAVVEPITATQLAAIENTATYGSMMTNLADSVPNEGGFLGVIMGENSLATFGSNLLLFGNAFVAYGKAVIQLSSSELTAIENITPLVTMMVELNDAIPNTGGVVSFFTGNNDFDKFGSQLLLFGMSFTAYGQQIGLLSHDQIGKIEPVATGLYWTLNALLMMPDSSKINQLDDLAAELPTLAGAISGWASTTKDISTSDLQGVGDGLYWLFNGFLNMPSDVDDIGDAGEQLDLFADYITSFWSKISTIPTESLSAFSETLSQAAHDMLDSFTIGIDENRDDVTSSAESVAEQVPIVFKRGLYDASGRGYESYIMGSDWTKAFVTGMKSQQTILDAGVEQVAQSIIDTTNETIDRHSPPGEAIAVGRDWDEGLAIGLHDNAQVVTRASSDVSHSFMEGIDLSGVGDSLSGLTDNIDLSGITDSFSSLASDTTASIGSFEGGLDGILNEFLNPEAIEEALGGVTEEIDAGLSTQTDLYSSAAGTQTGIVQDAVDEQAQIREDAITEEIDRLKKFNEDVKAIQKDMMGSYDNDIAQSLRDQISDLTATDAIAELQLQNQLMQEFDKQVAELQARGLAQGQLDEFVEMGWEDAIMPMQMFVGMTDEQLAAFNAEYRAMEEYTRQIAINNVNAQEAAEAAEEAAYRELATKNVDSGTAGGVLDSTFLVDPVAVSNSATAATNAVVTAMTTYDVQEQFKMAGTSWIDSMIVGVQSAGERLIQIATDIATRAAQQVDHALSSISRVTDLSSENFPGGDFGSIVTPSYTTDLVTKTSSSNIQTNNTNNNTVTKVTNLYQTNNSPKALSTTEIYRQTKGLVAQYS